MSGYVGDLSSKQEAALKEFRQRVRKFIPPAKADDDYYLLRWLRAREFDIDKSEQMLHKSVVFRKEKKLDSIIESFKVPEFLAKYYPVKLFGFAKDGSPIIIIRTGIIDRKGVFLSIRRDELLQFCLYLVEKTNRLCEQQSEKLGRHISGMVIIQDFQGYSLRNMYRPALTFFAQMAKIYEENYPELLSAMYIINAPRVFYIAYAVVKPFVQERTKKKIQIYSGNFQNALLEAISADNLPKALGGECVDEDGNAYCESIIGTGGEVPKSFYLSDETRSTEGYTTVIVSARDSLSLDYNIKVPGTVLRWEFRTDSHNISFGVFKNIQCEDGYTEKLDVVSVMHRDCHLYTEEGSYCCEDRGHYTLYFDNTFSWITSKTLHYLIEVMVPDDEIKQK